ncbi:exosome complex component MTR3 isoform X2 [Hylaeus anthracinus]|uniref:exosome complex component MTR3 isoform X2 n=1 Tax=Hylaeus anthracinus TaxID=313031 RepID=UPI0023B9263A|nr:exosome complex component MTR3 isoform X2 [Hylaeus anthracinus]
MPVDHKRINGPDVSVPYQIYSDTDNKDVKIKHDFTKRKDKRAMNEMRKIFLKTGVVSQAKGSAYIEMGTTKVVCSVFDPREVPNKNGYCMQGEIYCEFKFASFSCWKRKIHQQNAEEKQYSLMLQRALEPAVCLGLYDKQFLVDPTDLEEEICNTLPEQQDDFNHGIITLASLPQHGQISEVFLIGSIDTNSVIHATELLTTTNKEICPVLQQCLVKTIMKLHN